MSLDELSRVTSVGVGDGVTVEVGVGVVVLVSVVAMVEVAVADGLTWWGTTCGVDVGADSIGRVAVDADTSWADAGSGV